jgi:hypothetical protein
MYWVGLSSLLLERQILQELQDNAMGKLYVTCYMSTVTKLVTVCAFQIRKTANRAPLAACFMLMSCLAYTSAMNMMAKRSSETSVVFQRTKAMNHRRYNSS